MRKFLVSLIAAAALAAPALAQSQCQVHNGSYYFQGRVVPTSLFGVAEQRQIQQMQSQQNQLQQQSAALQSQLAATNAAQIASLQSQIAQNSAAQSQQNQLLIAFLMRQQTAPSPQYAPVAPQVTPPAPTPSPSPSPLAPQIIQHHYYIQPPQQALPIQPPQQVLPIAPPQQVLPIAPPQQIMPIIPPQQQIPIQPPQQDLNPIKPPQQQLLPGPGQPGPGTSTIPGYQSFSGQAHAQLRPPVITLPPQDRPPVITVDRAFAPVITTQRSFAPVSNWTPVR